MKYLIPEFIETERLLLRTFKEEDWKDLFHYYSDEDCMRYTSGETMNEWQTWRKMASMVGHWELRKYGPYAVEVKESGRVAGIVGLWFPIEWPEPEIKWGLAPHFQGKGYASEAAEAVRSMASKYLPDTSLISIIHKSNLASIKVATSIGATYEKDTEMKGEECVQYRHRSNQQ